MNRPQTLHCVREDIALGLEAVLEDVVNGLCDEWHNYDDDDAESSYFDAVRDAVTELRDAVNNSGDAVLALRDESRWTKESRRCYALAKELEVAKRELREKRAAIRELTGVLSEVKELLTEAEAEGDERIPVIEAWVKARKETR